MKWVVESSPAAVTRRSGKTATLRLSGGCHPTERSWMEEVATRLPADRPLPDDGLFVDQSEMIYSMDCDPFIANRSFILGPCNKRKLFITSSMLLGGGNSCSIGSPSF
ncbi:unnamed protein product [Spirodela intermedia]|uniref:Uncharacterized protein n=1 Tax=Spirodela intermedia TaxID=51605 RepID=A0A7I8I8U4_SPIIN|nr:unnamed protein product [Spirodela intermedia]CAA6654030.1 unnamed protein product [Spirodela intermedia]